MAKAVLIALSEDIPDTELNKAVTVTIEGRTYNGIVNAVVLHTPVAVPVSTKVTIEAPGLIVSP